MTTAPIPPSTSRSLKKIARLRLTLFTAMRRVTKKPFPACRCGWSANAATTTGTGRKATAGSPASIKKIWWKVKRRWISKPMRPARSASRWSGGLTVWKWKRQMTRSAACASGQAIAGRITATVAARRDRTASPWSWTNRTTDLAIPSSCTSLLRRPVRAMRW